MSKHTKGPWEAHVTGDDDVRVCQTVGGQCVCCVAMMGDYDGQSWTQETIETWRANAALIAAAPDMFDALKLAAEVNPYGCVENAKARDAARAALAKVEEPKAPLPPVAPTGNQYAKWIEQQKEGGA